jgi:hypothetical protein
MGTARSMRRGTALLLGLLMAASGCGPTVLDTTSVPALSASLEALREPMEPAERDRFDEALGYLVGEAVIVPESPDPAYARLVLQMYRPLNGLTADGITAEARRRRFGEVQAAIAAEEAGRAASEDARRQLAKFRLTTSRVYKRNRGMLEWPLIEFKAVNGTGSKVWLVHFRAALLKPEEEEPWLEEEFDQLLLDGLEPGAGDIWRIEPEKQEWIQLIDPHPDLQFTLEVMSLQGYRGKVLAQTDWGAIEAHRLALYRETLGLLRTTGTLVLDGPPRVRPRAKTARDDPPESG